MTLLSATILLFLVMDPLGNLPIFVAILGDIPPQRRWGVLIRELVISLVVLLAFLLAGKHVLALLHIGIVHMAHVIFSPTVFPISTAMFTGHTPKKKLVKGHGGMLKQIAAEHGVTASKEAPHV